MSRILVDEKEWEAYKHLAEVTHEELRVRWASVTEQLEVYKRLDAERVHAAAKAELTLKHMREENLKQHTLILQMQKRLAELEPVRISTPQPAFRKP